MADSPNGWGKGRITIASLQTQQQPEKLLLERARQGNRHAFDLLVLKYQRRLFNVVRHILKNPEDSLDVLQDVFLKAYLGIGKFREDSTFYTWLYTIAVNSAKRYFISRERYLAYKKDPREESQGEAQGEKRPPLDSSLPLGHNNNSELGHEETPERLLLCEEIQQAISEAFERLPKELRMVITLYEVEGMRYGEIAKVMGCPVGTVRSRIFRAREAIESSLRPLLNGNPPA